MNNTIHGPHAGLLRVFALACVVAVPVRSFAGSCADVGVTECFDKAGHVVVDERWNRNSDTGGGAPKIDRDELQCAVDCLDGDPDPDSLLPPPGTTGRISVAALDAATIAGGTIDLVPSVWYEMGATDAGVRLPLASRGPVSLRGNGVQVRVFVDPSTPPRGVFEHVVTSATPTLLNQADVGILSDRCVGWSIEDLTVDVHGTAVSPGRLAGFRIEAARAFRLDACAINPPGFAAGNPGIDLVAIELRHVDHALVLDSNTVGRLGQHVLALSDEAPCRASGSSGPCWSSAGAPGPGAPCALVQGTVIEGQIEVCPGRENSGLRVVRSSFFGDDNDGNVRGPRRPSFIDVAGGGAILVEDVSTDSGDEPSSLLQVRARTSPLAQDRVTAALRGIRTEGDMSAPIVDVDADGAGVVVDHWALTDYASSERHVLIDFTDASDAGGVVENVPMFSDNIAFQIKPTSPPWLSFVAVADLPVPLLAKSRYFDAVGNSVSPPARSRSEGWTHTILPSAPSGSLEGGSLFIARGGSVPNAGAIFHSPAAGTVERIKVCP